VGALVVSSTASLAANVAVAQPTAAGRVIAPWPSFALIGAYELLMRQVRRSAANGGKPPSRKPVPAASHPETGDPGYSARGPVGPARAQPGLVVSATNSCRQDRVPCRPEPARDTAG